MIYFVQRQDEIIKIGWVSSAFFLKKRVRELQYPAKLPVQLLGVIPGKREHEAELHQKFSEFRWRTDEKFNGVTEWFNPDPTIMDYIRRYGVSDSVLCQRYENMKLPMGYDLPIGWHWKQFEES